MLKRYLPTQPDGTRTLFELPESYLGGSITIFINGQMLHCQDEASHPYGFSLDQENKTFSFYVAPDEDDALYVLYEYSIQLSFENVDWTKTIRSIDFSSKIQKSVWDSAPIKTIWEKGCTPIVWENKPITLKWEQQTKKQTFTAKVHTKI